MSATDITQIADPAALSPDQVILRDTLIQIEHILDGSEQNISGKDVINMLAAVYDAATLVSLPASRSPIQAHVIFSPSEEGFWRRDEGWSHINSASHYFQTPNRIPDSTGNDAMVVTLASGRQIQDEMDVKEAAEIRRHDHEGFGI